MVRSTPLSARTPGKLFVTPRTVRIGCPGWLLGPALVLVDIVAGDQLGRNEDCILGWCFPSHDVHADLVGLLGHRVGILRRSGFEQATLALQCGHGIRRAIDAHDKELIALGLLGGKITANSCWI